MLTPSSPPCDVGIIRAAPETPGCASHAKRWVLAATVLGSSVASIGASVINVALPAIQSGVGASVGQMQWIASVYTLLLAALTLAAGSAGDRYGRRPFFVAGLVVIAVASGAAAVVTNGAELIAARAVQGVGAALLVPNSLALLSAAFPRAERGRAIGTWAAASSLTGAAAPIAGGLLVDAVSWRAAFLLVVPLALLALGVALVRVPEVRVGRPPRTIDWSGSVLATAGLAVLVFGLISLADGPGALVGVAGGIVTLLAFVRHEARTTSPMTPLRLFRSPTFVGVNVLTLLLYFAVAAAFFVLPFALVRLHGYSTWATGAAYLPFALVVGALSRPAGRLVDRVGARVPLVGGTLVAAAGLLLLAVPGAGGSYGKTFLVPMLVIGFGMAVTVAPLTSTVMASVPDADVGVASGVNNTVARVAALLAVAVAGLTAVSVFESALADRLAMLPLPPAVRQAVAIDAAALGAVTVPAVATDAQRDAIHHAARRAFVTAFRSVAALAAMLAALGALAAGLGVEAVPTREPDDVAAPCAHVSMLVDAVPQTQGCEECLRLGVSWVQLLVCLTCGHVGCCDSSRLHHATDHFWATAHPVVRSLEPGTTWRWCYVDETSV